MYLKDKIIMFLIASGIFGASLSYNKIYLYHIFIVLVILNLILSEPKKNFSLMHNRLPSKMLNFFYFMIGWYTLSVFWSIYPIYSIRYMVYILSGAFYSLSVIYYINVEKDKLNRVYLLTATIFIFIIMISMLEIFADIKVPRLPNSSSYKSASAFFGNINNLSTVLVILLPFFLFHRNLFIKYSGSLAIIGMVFMNSSRANILAIVAIIIIHFFAYRGVIKYSKIEKRILILGIIVLSIYIFNNSPGIIRNSYYALERYINMSKIEGNDSIGVRQRLIYNGINALKESKGLGVGGGASLYVQEKIRSTKGTTSMHNLWVETLVEGGLIFFMVFAAWYLSLIKQLYFISYKSDGHCMRYYSASTSLALIGFIPAAVSPSTTIYMLPMWLLFGFSLAVINVYKGKRESKNQKT